jgi:hypothetical protein
MCSGTEDTGFGYCLFVGLEAHDADFIMFIKLFMAISISRVDLRLICNLIFLSTKS